MSTTPMYFEQPIVIFDTTQATNLTSGSFVLYGGVSINATHDSSNFSSGSFVLAGGMGIHKKVNIGGVTTVHNSTESSSVSDGALVVVGGAGIQKNLNVGGNVSITGDLYVAGTTTTINTTTIDVEDNTILLNSGPLGSRDAGIVIRRDGVDVVADVAYTSGTLQNIANENNVTLPAGASGLNDFYKGFWINLDNTQGRAQISGYNGSTKIATLSTYGNTLSAGNLTETGFSLHNRSYFAQYYDESSDEFRFAYISDATDPKTSL